MNRHDWQDMDFERGQLSVVLGVIGLLVIAIIIIVALSGCRMIKHEAEREVIKFGEKAIEQIIEKKVGELAIKWVPWALTGVGGFLASALGIKLFKNGRKK